MTRYAAHDTPLPGTQPVRWREVVREYPCPTCLAGPGDDCTTINGTRKYEPHSLRSRAASANGWQLPSLVQTPTPESGQMAKWVPCETCGERAGHTGGGTYVCNLRHLTVRKAQ